MSQNLISLALTADQLTAIEGALATLEENLTGLIALQPAQRRALAKMGDKSEVFCRQTLKLLQQNPQVVPPSLDVTEAAADLVAKRCQRQFRGGNRRRQIVPVQRCPSKPGHLTLTPVLFRQPRQPRQHRV